MDFVSFFYFENNFTLLLKDAYEIIVLYNVKTIQTDFSACRQ